MMLNCRQPTRIPFKETWLWTMNTNIKSELIDIYVLIPVSTTHMYQHVYTVLHARMNSMGYVYALFIITPMWLHQFKRCL